MIFIQVLTGHCQVVTGDNWEQLDNSLVWNAKKTYTKLILGWKSSFKARLSNLKQNFACPITALFSRLVFLWEEFPILSDLGCKANFLSGEMSRFVRSLGTYLQMVMLGSSAGSNQSLAGLILSSSGLLHLLLELPVLLLLPLHLRQDVVHLGGKELRQKASMSTPK